MGCLYPRGNVLWLAFKNESGARICRSSGFKIGQEASAQALLAELESKATAGVATKLGGTALSTDEEPAPVRAVAAWQPNPLLLSAGTTVLEYALEWLETRKDLASAADERGRVENHILPYFGHMPLAEVRPFHVRDFVMELKKSRVHKRGTGKGFGTAKLAPRTVRHIYAALQRLFASAVVDELIPSSPIMLKKEVLPKNVDKDPTWRAGAIFERRECVRLAYDVTIPHERRVLYAIKGFAGMRHGEVAGLRVAMYSPKREPLAKLTVARSYDKDGTKTQVTRYVPAHHRLADILDEWLKEGWAKVYGRNPHPEDLLVPRSPGALVAAEALEPDEYEDALDDYEEGDPSVMSDADPAQKLFLKDLAALGMRPRRGHDLRRTFITLAQQDGANRDVIKVITHAPDAQDVMDLYTSFPFEVLCEEVMKLKLEPLVGHEDSQPPSSGSSTSLAPASSAPAASALTAIPAAGIATSAPTSGHVPTVAKPSLPHLALVPNVSTETSQGAAGHRSATVPTEIPTGFGAAGRV
ncbi:MAG TPA: N-terminal phage integrase SAM-like domain-containing protein [Kofleriaceae bacterium]|nr:N-terminal phage integrase SAM-like domain-containing protein [Kofleriaceae bacterium]